MVAKQKKKVGAPLGNTNAIKHGLYSKQKQLDFTNCSREGLTKEITYVRAILDYVVELIPTIENPNLLLQALATVANSSVKLSFLLEHISRGANNDLYNEITKAITEVNKELRGSLSKAK